MEKPQINLGLRLGSMILDHFIMCFIIVPPLIIIGQFSGSNNSFTITNFEKVTFFITMFIYLNKDAIKSQSIAKRILGLRVINKRTGEPANAFQCFLRNLTIPLWPLEVLFTLGSPSRRLGDHIANTKVDIAEKQPLKTILKDIKQIKLSKYTLGIVITAIFYFGLLWTVTNITFRNDNNNFSESNEIPYINDSIENSSTNNNHHPNYDTTGRTDSLNALVPEKTETLTLIYGQKGPSGATIKFKSSNDTLIAREIPNAVEWEREKEDVVDKVKEEYLNKNYKVTYKLQSIWYESNEAYEDVMVISKMQSVK